MTSSFRDSFPLPFIKSSQRGKSSMALDDLRDLKTTDRAESSIRRKKDSQSGRLGRGPNRTSSMPDLLSMRDTSSFPEPYFRTESLPVPGASVTRKPKKAYPLAAADYEFVEQIGRGGSATVWKATCLPLNETVAIKLLDLEKCNNSQESIHSEIQMMSMTSHPNLLHAHAFFTKGHHVWLVMPFSEAGSCDHIMRTCRPAGLEEPVVATILRDTLKALEYLHRGDHIHRDVKAGNILIDGQGIVRLADFGVSAGMFKGVHCAHDRTQVVGTPQWMAPEVLQRTPYNCRADIWSFGITALELAHGHAPFSDATPQEVLMNTLAGPSPGLEREREKHFSKAFKDMVAMCLVKDPAKRPSAEKLLKHPFFKQAKGPDYLVKSLVQDLPSSLGERERSMQRGKEDQQKQGTKCLPSRSVKRYQEHMTTWNFDLDLSDSKDEGETSSEETPPTTPQLQKAKSIKKYQEGLALWDFDSSTLEALRAA